jgi:hypothetical protein
LGFLHGHLKRLSGVVAACCMELVCNCVLLPFANVRA